MGLRKLSCRVVRIKPVKIAPSPVGMTIPIWWLQRNNSPEQLEGLEIKVSQGKLVIHAPPREKEDTN